METDELLTAADVKDLIAELRKTNDLLATMVKNQANWRNNLRQGLLTGLGGVLGATVLVSMLLWMLQPLKRLDALKPTLDEISRQLERGAKRGPQE